MESNLIAGALIAITSGAIVQLVNTFLDIKKEKRKFIFEKITDIINSISTINEGLQQDAAIFYNVGPPNGSMIELSQELVKIKCIVKVYHPALSSSIDKFIESTNNYFSAKRDFFHAQKQGASGSQLDQKVEIFKVSFELCIKEIDSFIGDLSKYGSR
jgi:hypothetical protein